jgi:hypothetical protein
MPLLPFEKPGADSLGDSCRSLAPRPLIFTVAILRATHGTTGASGSALKDAWFVTALHLPVIRMMTVQVGRQPRETVGPSPRASGRSRGYNPREPLGDCAARGPTSRSGSAHEITPPTFERISPAKARFLNCVNPGEPLATGFARPNVASGPTGERSVPHYKTDLPK